MNEYKTSNGATVYLDSGGRLKFQRDSPVCANTLEDFWVQAAREFFQAERDETLGRWRDPENPDMVVYPHDDVNTTVHDETTGAYLNWSREQAEDDEYSRGFGFATARAYFAVHPEPKPWDAAQPDCDEIWVLTIHGCEQPVYVTEFRGETVFQVPDGETISPHRKSITAGRRIWPEEDK